MEVTSRKNELDGLQEKTQQLIENAEMYIEQQFKQPHFAAKIAVGSMTGLLIGFVGKKIGKLVLTTVLGGFTTMRILERFGYIQIKDNVIKEDLQKVSNTISRNVSLETIYKKAKEVVKKNGLIVLAFASGVLIGMKI